MGSLKTTTTKTKIITTMMRKQRKYQIWTTGYYLKKSTISSGPWKTLFTIFWMNESVEFLFIDKQKTQMMTQKNLRLVTHVKLACKELEMGLWNLTFLHISFSCVLQRTLKLRDSVGNRSTSTSMNIQDLNILELVELRIWNTCVVFSRWTLILWYYYHYRN